MVPRFHWLQKYADTLIYYQSFPQYELSLCRKGDRAPIINMPITDTLFSCIAMDIVGPLDRSSAGHKYILVVCDYATRYPDTSTDQDTRMSMLISFPVTLEE